MEKIKLNNGLKMPQEGIGTYLLKPNEAYESVVEALNDGYRLIDTANIYGNVVSVGKAIKDSKIERKDIFVSTKIWPSEYNDKDIVDKTLKRMNLDYIDLLFLHQPSKGFLEGYTTLINAYNEGKIKAIGLSNFEGKYIQEILTKFDVIPQIMQVECHPSFSQKELRKLLGKHGIHLMAWYPLGGKGNDSLLNNKTLKEIAIKYHKSVAQIIIKWHIQMGFIVIPGSKNKEHIKDNIAIDDFNLSSSDMDIINSLDSNKRFYTRTEEALNHFLTITPTYEE